MNDYGELAHPSILEAMASTNLSPKDGYYNDSHSENAKGLIRKELGGRQDVQIHFIPSGTLTNLIAISAFLRPHQSVIAPKTAHINNHEAGAIEAVGHKVLVVDTDDGKITPEEIRPVLEEHQEDNKVMPKMVCISNSTEIGTIYTKDELSTLYKFCKKNDLILYCDGARLGSALTSKYSDLSMKDMVNYTDAFYIGGTKNGALIGEALIIANPTLTADFRYIAKQKGGMLAKGAIVGIQFEELFRNSLFYDLARHENQMAEILYEGLKEKGYSFLETCQSNQVFPILTLDKINELEKKFQFYRWKKLGDEDYAIRLVTSWATKQESVMEFINSL